MTDAGGRQLTPGEPGHAEIEFGGGKLRTYVDRPDLPGRQPAVLFIQGFDCASMEHLGEHPYGKFVRGLVALGFVVMRVEKPGAELDLYAELGAFEAALGGLKTCDFVDPERVFLFGHSMGGLVAPLIAEKVQVKGIAVYGTSLKPWRELIPETFAFQLPHFDVEPAECDSLVRDLREIMTQFYGDRKSPAEIAKNARHGAILTNHFQLDGQGNLWGRHFRYWQQLDDFDLTGVWSRTTARVLSMFGELDFEVFSDLEARTIADLVNRSRPGNAEFLRIDRTSHLFCRLGSMKDNVQNHNLRFMADHYNDEVVLKTAAWMRRVLAG